MMDGRQRDNQWWEGEKYRQFLCMCYLTQGPNLNSKGGKTDEGDDEGGDKFTTVSGG